MGESDLVNRRQIGFFDTRIIKTSDTTDVDTVVKSDYETVEAVEAVEPVKTVVKSTRKPKS